MALNIEDKKAIVAEVNEAASKALSAVVADSCGIPVAMMTKLRKDCRDNNVYLHVVRNTLLARAVEGTEFECMKDAFKGPTLIGLSMEHPGAAARIFKEFAKANQNFTVKALAEEGIAKLLATMKEAAAGKLVRTLAALGDKLKAEGGEAPAVAE